MHIATLAPGELSGFILPVTIISITLNIVFIAALVLVIILFITTRKKLGKLWYAYIMICTKVLLIKDSYVYPVMFNISQTKH